MAQCVLHIDCDENTLKLVTRNLRGWDFRIVSANTLDFFHRTLDEGNIDLVIIGDLSVGRDNRNFALLKAIKQDPKTTHIPVIMLTSRKLDANSAFDSGAAEYLTKPFQPMALLTAISRIFNPQESDEEGGADA